MSDDYRQLPNSDRSRPAILVCQQGVPPELLSGWRDGLLPPDQAAWLERHTPTCPACGERLRDYDAAASALSGQVIPRPSADLWPGVRAAIERETRGMEDGARRAPRLPHGLALGGIGAGVVALLLVALFAGLLRSRQTGRPTAAATPTATLAATATTAATATPSGPGYWTTITGCSGVPAGVRTVYNAGIQEQKSAPTIVTLQRSDDCGATWTKLTPPQMAGVSYTTNVNLMTIFTSPRNPDTAYLTLQVNSAQACSSTSSVTARTALSSTVCQPQYVTTNGGVSWQRLALPVRGILGNISPVDAVLGSALRPQGSRLYGVVTDAMLTSSGVIPPGRLVASDDGGVTWHIADAPLAAQGLAIWDFAPVPTGSTVYVTAEPVSDPAREPPQYGATLTMWSSPDGGATWKQASNPPDVTPQSPILNMGAGASASGRRTLYVAVGDKSGLTVLGSLDDGATWRSDSHLTTSSGGSLSSPEIVGSLPDGSAVVVDTGNAPTVAWLPGSAPRIIAQSPGFASITNPIFQQRGDGLYLWLMGTLPDSGSALLTTEYTQLKL